MMKVYRQVRSKVLDAHEKKHLREESEQEPWMFYQGRDLHLLLIFVSVAGWLVFVSFGLDCFLLSVVAVKGSDDAGVEYEVYTSYYRKIYENMKRVGTYQT